MKKLFSLLFILFCLKPFAQTAPKVVESVKWTFSHEVSKENKDEIILIAEASIAKDCHIYSQDTSSDGPVPTSFQFKKDSVNYILTGKAEETGAEKKYDNAFQSEVSSFSGKAIFKQKIKRISKSDFKISGEVEFMYCNSIQCYPPKTISFTIEIPGK